jgi:hypothetical protein
MRVLINYQLARPSWYAPISIPDQYCSNPCNCLQAQRPIIHRIFQWIGRVFIRKNAHSWKKRVFKRNYCLCILCYTYYMITTSCKNWCVKFHSWNSFFSLTSKSKSNPSLWRAGFTIALHCQGQTCLLSLRIGLGLAKCDHYPPVEPRNGHLGNIWVLH